MILGNKCDLNDKRQVFLITFKLKIKFIYLILNL